MSGEDRRWMSTGAAAPGPAVGPLAGERSYADPIGWRAGPTSQRPESMKDSTRRCVRSRSCEGPGSRVPGSRWLLIVAAALDQLFAYLLFQIGGGLLLAGGQRARTPQEKCGLPSRAQRAVAGTSMMMCAVGRARARAGEGKEGSILTSPQPSDRSQLPTSALNTAGRHRTAASSRASTRALTEHGPQHGALGSG
jgi:hypothetical protein